MPFALGRITAGPRIAIIPPPDYHPHAWNQVFSKKYRLSARSVTSTNECLHYLADEQTLAYVLLGDRAWRDVFFDSARLRQGLRGKLVYRMGSSARGEARALLREGLAAFIGYDGEFRGFPNTRRFETSVARPFIAGLRALRVGKNAAGVEANIRYEWLTLMLEIQDSNTFVSGETMALLNAESNLEKLFLFGDGSWQISSRPTLMLLSGLAPADDGKMPNERNHIFNRPAVVNAFGARRDLVPRVEIVDISLMALSLLRTDPSSIANLSPHQFEDLVADRLRAMNFTVHKVGGTYERDGGIDFFAVPNSGPFPFVLAVQVKHSHSGRKVGPSVVRELKGVLSNQPLCMGLIVTNTGFTPDAEWTARQAPILIRLRGFSDLQKWLQDEFSGDDVYDELPRFVELAPGICVPVPRPIGSADATTSQ